MQVEEFQGGRLSGAGGVTDKTVSGKKITPARGLRVLAAFAALLLGSILAGATMLSARTLAAQSRGPVQRTVSGKVVDKTGKGLKGAVVYLQDDRDSSVRTAIADEDGGFHFVQLAQNADYTVWAKADGKRSANKAISSFDSRTAYTLSLKIE
jgi:hypothetical protein